MAAGRKRLIFRAVLAGCLALLAVACAPPNDTANSQYPHLFTFDKLPAVVEGEFTVNVMEGDEDPPGYAEHNFGTIDHADKQILVQVSGRVLARSGLPPTGGRARATLGEKTDAYGPATYIITELEKLP